jgi:hypothetical protein
MYLDGSTDDDRIEAALDELRPLPEVDAEPSVGDLRTVVRDIVREELD